MGANELERLSGPHPVPAYEGSQGAIASRARPRQRAEDHRRAGVDDAPTEAASGAVRFAVRVFLILSRTELRECFSVAVFGWSIHWAAVIRGDTQKRVRL